MISGKHQWSADPAPFGTPTELRFGQQLKAVLFSQYLIQRYIFLVKK